MGRRTALYRHYSSRGKLLYVGISYSPLIRLRQHYRSSAWAYKAAIMKTTWYSTRRAALDAEKRAIRSENPRYNKLHNKKPARVSWLGVGLLLVVFFVAAKFMGLI